MSTLKVNELDTKSGTTITVAAGKTFAGNDIIGAAQIATDAVTADAIAANAVDSSEIAAGAVTNVKTDFQPGTTFKGDGSSADGKITLNCSQNTHGVSIQSPTHASAASYTLTLPTTDGNADEFMQTDGSGVLTWAAPPGGLFSAYAIICDQKTAGTAGGTFTQDAWRTRELNTELADPSSIVTISSNQFTLGAGNYLVKWSAPAVQVDRHQTRFFDHTGAAALGTGTSENAETTMVGYPAEDNKISNRSIGMIRLTPSGSNVYSIEHYCTVTNATDGFGIAANFGRPETYTMVEIYKES